MNKSFEEKPLYRFFNVVFFTGYAFVFLVSVLIGWGIYQNRPVVNATVQCNDGTSWNALKPNNILDDPSALCGICSKRSSDGKYNFCAYQDNYSVYTTQTTQEGYQWITAFLIAIVIGFGIIDIVKIAIVYIFSGKADLSKSLLIIILAILFSGNKNNSWERDYKLLFKIVDKKQVIKDAQLQTQISKKISELEIQLNTLYKNAGKNEDFFKTNEILNLDIHVLQEFYKLDDEKGELELYQSYYLRYFDILENLNQKLKKGYYSDDGKKEYKEEKEKIDKDFTHKKASLISSKALSEAILEAKRKGKDINTKDLIDKVSRKIKEDPFFKKDN
jgi:hypothetical protein